MPRSLFVLLLIVSLGAIAAEALCISSLAAKGSGASRLPWAMRLAPR